MSKYDIETGQKYSFREMKDLSIRCALWMIKQGIKQTDVIVLCTHNHINTFIPFLATLYTGAIFNAWYHEMNLNTTEYFMQFIKPKIIFADKNCIEDLEAAAKKANLKIRIITFDEIPGYIQIRNIMNEQTENEVNNFRCTKIDDINQTALIIFSSGTTGLPKGVELSHKAMLNTMVLLESGVFKSENSRSLWYSSMYWISAIMLRLMCFLKCATAIIHKDFDPIETCKIIEKYKVSWLFLSTSSFHYLYKANVFDKYDMSTLRQIAVGGAKVNTEALKQSAKALPNTLVVQGYGMSEMGGLITTPSNKCITSVGMIAANVQLKVIDQETGRNLEHNKIGELCFKSPYMMTGYYLNPEATRITIDEEGYVHSGDLGYYDQNGFVFVVDRIKEILKVKGHHVAPVEIEDQLRKHPDITECAVIGVPHLLDNNHPMAFVSKKVESKIIEEDVLKLAEKLGDLNKLRAGVQFLAKLPHTPSGKVDRKRLREMAKTFLNHENYIQ